MTQRQVPGGGPGDASRRRFLGLLWAGLGALAVPPRQTLAGALPPRRPAEPHPDPRPGITAARVLPPDRIRNPEARPVYDLVREIPQVVDGIRCHCGCASLEGFYSLLTCYEANGMAQACHICQGEARLASRLHKDGWSLNGIRAAIDAQYGDLSG